MLSAWPVLVFGFPGALVSVLLSILGVAYRQPALLILGAVTAVPSAYYFGGHPGTGPLLFVLPALPLLSSVAVGRKQRLIAGLLLIPNAAAAVWLTAVTLSNLAG